MQIDKDTTYYLEILVTNKAGNPVTGLTITYDIFRSSSDTSVSSGNLSELGGGIYKESYFFNTLGQYRIIYRVPSPYSDNIETIIVGEQSNTSVNLKLDRILGLVQENFRIFDPVYNQANDMTAGVIKLYSNGTDLENDTNPFAIYEVKATYGQGKNKRLVTGYQSKRIL